MIFGEVLFDCFPDGNDVLGGAPFNVAWHLQGFGYAPLFVSRVGDDERGATVRRAMEAWGMSTEGLQTHATAPTGVVQISFREGEPEYDITPDQAYDRIDAEAACDAVKATSPALLYHGTLALRAATSLEALHALHVAAGAPTFLDLNLRSPWWDTFKIRSCLATTTWLKLNEDELGQLPDVAMADGASRQDICRRLFDRYELQAIFLTRGGRGAEVHTREGELFQEEAAPRAETVDTVGAGDAFSAVTIAGLLDGWPPSSILSRASRFASAICGQQGATRDDPGLYQQHREQWDDE